MTVVERPGYGGAPGSVGDAAALVSGPPAAVVSHGGQLVVQACNLVTVEDIRAAGGLIWANPLAGGVERVFFDGQGTAPLPLWGGVLPSQTEANSCQTLLEPNDDRGVVHVTVYQSSYAAPEAMDDRQQMLTPRDPIGAVLVFEDTKPSRFLTTTRWWLRLGDTAVALEVKHPERGFKAQILTTAARNLERLLLEPQGPVSFRFDSPALAGDTARACEMFTAADFQSIVTVAPGPVVLEATGTAVGVITFTSERDGRGHNYVISHCDRHTPEPDRRLQTLVQVRMETYETVDAATIAVRQDREFTDGGLTPVPEPIGDEPALYSHQPGLTDALTFRVGRVVTHIAHVERATAVGAPDQRVRALTRAARAIAARLTTL